MRQTTYPKGEITSNRKWFIIDVKDCKLGRVASRIASLLIGKNDPLYTPYANNGPGVIVINAAHIKVTGNKLQNKFYWHTGFPGGIRSRTMEERLNSKQPEQVIFKAVQRMVPRNVLGRNKMRNLRVFAHEQHVHSGLKPTVIDVAGMHYMNTISKV